MGPGLPPRDGLGVAFSAAIRRRRERAQSSFTRFLRACSNTSRAQVRGIMKGAIMRCVDSAESADQCKSTILDTMGEFLKVGHGSKTFRSALCDLSRQYVFLEDVKRTVNLLCRMGV